MPLVSSDSLDGEEIGGEEEGKVGFDVRDRPSTAR